MTKTDSVQKNQETIERISFSISKSFFHVRNNMALDLYHLMTNFNLEVFLDIINEALRQRQLMINELRNDIYTSLGYEFQVISNEFATDSDSIPRMRAAHEVSMISFNSPEPYLVFLYDPVNLSSLLKWFSNHIISIDPQKVSLLIKVTKKYNQALPKDILETLDNRVTFQIIYDKFLRCIHDYLAEYKFAKRTTLIRHLLDHSTISKHIFPEYVSNLPANFGEEDFDYENFEFSKEEEDYYEAFGDGAEYPKTNKNRMQSLFKGWLIELSKTNDFFLYKKRPANQRGKAPSGHWWVSKMRPKDDWYIHEPI